MLIFSIHADSREGHFYCARHFKNKAKKKKKEVSVRSSEQ